MQLLSIFRLFYFLGAVNSLFFSVLIFSKKNIIIADKILGTWLIILCAQLLIPFLYLTDLNTYYKYAGLEIVFYAFHPVLLYYYIKATIGRLPAFRSILLNLIPIVLLEIAELSFFVFPAKERLRFIEGVDLLPWYFLPFVILMFGYFYYFIYTSYKTLKDYKDEVLQVFSYRENVDLLWLRRLVMMFAGITVLVFPLGMVSYYYYHSMVFADYFFFVTLVIFIFFLGYWGYQQGHIFNFKNDLEPAEINVSDTSTINNTNVLRQYKKEKALLEDIMKSKKPYTEPELTIYGLAQLINLPPHHLSKVINTEFHCNFFEFVNSYRVEEFRQKASSGEFKNLTILGIALECGFNSKSSFNRIFKEATGITPGEYIKHPKL
jgi:AraC-like DNA-binding protein